MYMYNVYIFNELDITFLFHFRLPYISLEKYTEKNKLIISGI